MDDFFHFATMKGGGHRLELTGPIVTSRPWWSKDGEQFACSTEFDAQLKALEGEELTVVIDSNGGDVAAGIAMYEALRNRKGETHCHIVRAYSAATLPLCAVPRRNRMISSVGTILIHDPATSASGTADELDKSVRFLRAIKTAVLAAYHEATGKSEAELSEMMTRETTMTAASAVENGFAESIANPAESAQMSHELMQVYMAASHEQTLRMAQAAAEAQKRDKERQEYLRFFEGIK